MGRFLSRWADQPWPIVPFAPLFFFAAFAGRFIVMAGGGEEIPFDDVLGVYGYPIWLWLGILCPVMLVASWWMIFKKSGRWRYSGLWVRFGANMGMACALAGFILAYQAEERALLTRLDDAHLMVLTLLTSIWVFLVVSVVRDVWVLVLTERVAHGVRNAGVDE
jgi:hypothetical protein